MSQIDDAFLNRLSRILDKSPLQKRRGNKSEVNTWTNSIKGLQELKEIGSEIDGLKNAIVAVMIRGKYTDEMRKRG
jgi:hypothetical protein